MHSSRATWLAPNAHVLLAACCLLAALIVSPSLASISSHKDEPASASGLVFVTSERSELWNGECASAGRCTRESPCELGSDREIRVKSADACTIVFAEGEYGALSIVSEKPLRLAASGVVASLQLAVVAPDVRYSAWPLESTAANFAQASISHSKISENSDDCILASKPSWGLFWCFNGTWTSFGSVVTNTSHTPIVIPKKTTIFINGNLTAPGGITFQGEGAKLLINGCLLANTGAITIDFATNDWIQFGNAWTLNPLVQGLDIGNSVCPIDLSRLEFAVLRPQTCKRVETETNRTERNSLVIAFKLIKVTCYILPIALSIVSSILAVTGLVALALYFRRRYLKSRREKRGYRPINEPGNTSADDSKY